MAQHRRSYTFRHDCLWRNRVRPGGTRIVFAAVYPDCVRAAWTNPIVDRPLVRGFFQTEREVVVEPYTQTLWINGYKLIGKQDEDGLWYVFSGKVKSLLEPEVVVKKTVRHRKPTY
jgi:hypothetical protein